MVITREIRDEMRNSVSTSINSVLKEEAFIKLIVEKVSDSLTKTLGEKIGELEQRINETNKKGFQEFKEIVLENDIDIMLLSETWVGPDDHSVVVDIPGYTLFRKDRVGRGGGVGAYVKVSFKGIPGNEKYSRGANLKISSLRADTDYYKNPSAARQSTFNPKMEDSESLIMLYHTEKQYMCTSLLQEGQTDATDVHELVISRYEFTEKKILVFCNQV
ncbi:hypothetical protein JTB14_026988 [Gonioctena quinquepunctata]|nr:hypothetical protein JTB14_026988 [Gonioctena quinquepunctata]